MPVLRATRHNAAENLNTRSAARCTRRASGGRVEGVPAARPQTVVAGANFKPLWLLKKSDRYCCSRRKGGRTQSDRQTNIIISDCCSSFSSQQTTQKPELPFCSSRRVKTTRRAMRHSLSLAACAQQHLAAAESESATHSAGALVCLMCQLPALAPSAKSICTSRLRLAAAWLSEQVNGGGRSDRSVAPPPLSPFLSLSVSKGRRLFAFLALRRDVGAASSRLETNWQQTKLNATGKPN